MIDRAIRTFLGRACGGKLAEFWADGRPTSKAIEYGQSGGPLSRTEAICLRVALDVWNGVGRATFHEVLLSLDDDNLAAVIALLRYLRPTAFGKAQADTGGELSADSSAMTEQCSSLSLTGLRCTLRRWHGGLHRSPGVEWLTDPREQPTCSRCGRRQSRHGEDGRDAQCPAGFAPVG